MSTASKYLISDILIIVYNPSSNQAECRCHQYQQPEIAVCFFCMIYAVRNAEEISIRIHIHHNSRKKHHFLSLLSLPNPDNICNTILFCNYTFFTLFAKQTKHKQYFVCRYYFTSFLITVPVGKVRSDLNEKFIIA